MNTSDYDQTNSLAEGTTRYKEIVHKLAFAALKEQTRARRWRIFFLMFFVVYLTVITSIFLIGDDSGGIVGNADGSKHTALVRLSGVIASGEEAGADNIVRGLKAAFKHKNTAQVILEINSPGGSPVQSAYIYDEIRRLKEIHPDIPMYTVVADIAASGGYFVAAASDKIYVNRSSLVGSIGVRMDNFGFVEMMKKLGVERRLLVAGENKGLFDPFLPENKAQVAHLQSMLDEVHQHFIDAVKQGRGDRLVESDGLFSGLVWSGERALALGLVDGYGTTPGLARLAETEKVIDFTPETELLQRIADRIGSSAGQQISEQIGGQFLIK
ncbi:MAG: protease-4 [Gammaproteobacteria bacterium]|jgi:protease-4